jgi:hypothetical protein
MALQLTAFMNIRELLCPMVNGRTRIGQSINLNGLKIACNPISRPSETGHKKSNGTRSIEFHASDSKVGTSLQLPQIPSVSISYSRLSS